MPFWAVGAVECVFPFIGVVLRTEAPEKLDAPGDVLANRIVEIEKALRRRGRKRGKDRMERESVGGSRFRDEREETK